MGPAWSFLSCVLSHDVATLGASEGFREVALLWLIFGQWSVLWLVGAELVKQRTEEPLVLAPRPTRQLPNVPEAET